MRFCAAQTQCNDIMLYFPDFVAMHKLAAPAAPAVAPVAVAPVEASPLAKDGDKTNTQVSSSANPASATLTMLLAGWCWCLASIVRF